MNLEKNWIPLSLVCSSGSHIKIGIFEKCSACSSFLFLTLRLVYTRWQVAAICHTATSQRQITLFVLDNFYENLCLRNRILSQQHVTKNQIIQFVQLVGVIKFCCRDKDFHKNSPVHTKQFVTVMCHCKVLLQLVTQPVHTEWSVSTTCCCNLSPSEWQCLGDMGKSLSQSSQCVVWKKFLSLR